MVAEHLPTFHGITLPFHSSNKNNSSKKCFLMSNKGAKNEQILQIFEVGIVKTILQDFSCKNIGLEKMFKTVSTLLQMYNIYLYKYQFLCVDLDHLIQVSCCFQILVYLHLLFYLPCLGTLNLLPQSKNMYCMLSCLQIEASLAKESYDLNGICLVK